jgi:CRISPR-associated endonuclease/helicase Cas3
MGRSSTPEKIKRLRQIEEILLDTPQGLTPAALARRLGVHRSTVSRYLPELPEYIYQDGALLKINRSQYPVQVDFSLHEALAVYLAARLLATRTDRRYRPASTGLKKLGRAMLRVAPLIGRHVEGAAAEMVDHDRLEDTRYIQTLERLAEAWASQRKVRLLYRKALDQHQSTHIVAPYFIEPSAVGQSVYLIGWSDQAHERRTFKVERIEQVVLLDERYEMPANFDPAEMLRDAWSIWVTPNEPVEVRLRFTPEAARRVRETLWHPSQALTPQADGGLVWAARVAEPTEMLPWILGWGAEVEVLAPDEVRQVVAEHARKMSTAYEV